MLERLNSLWVGDKIGWIEELCLRSATAAGHAFSVYSYTPDALQGLPPEIDLRDAREVMPESLLLRYADSGAVQLGSNLFRYYLLKQSLGYWVDMDCLFLKPLDIEADYVFGWERPDSINSAILKIPADSEMLSIIFQTMQNDTRPPWYGPKRTLQYYWRRAVCGPLSIDQLPWGTFGPQLVTYAAHKSRAHGSAQAQSVFYPVAYEQVSLFLENQEAARKRIEYADTRAVHLYRSALIRLVRSGRPPANSYLSDACDRFGVQSAEL
jgi:hypothetical protein